MIFSRGLSGRVHALVLNLSQWAKNFKVFMIYEKVKRGILMN